MFGFFGYDSQPADDDRDDDHGDHHDCDHDDHYDFDDDCDDHHDDHDFGDDDDVIAFAHFPEILSATTGDHNKWNQIFFVKVANYIGFCV